MAQKRRAAEYGECGGKGAAVDTALDFPERQNILGRSTNRSDADTSALPPSILRSIAAEDALSISTLDSSIRGWDLKLVVHGSHTPEARLGAH